MDCRAYCTASAYKMKPLFEALRQNYKATNFRDVIHIEVKTNGLSGEVSLFSFGAAVCWGLPRDKELAIIQSLHEFCENPLPEYETDEFTYVYGETQKVFEDEIVLPNADILTKLAISYGIAQSVKLGTFENALKKTFAKTRKIPEALAKHGRIYLSKKEIRRKMGELFIERNSINLHADVLDIPDFFWEYPELDPLYRMIANYLDISTRVEVLNQRLNVIHELFQMLDTELKHQHSSRLEWIIICLIVIEVIVSLSHYVFHWI